MPAMTTVLPELTLDGAERLSARISARLDGIADNYVAVMPLIREALNRNAHAVLGYVSPGAYIKDRFGDALGKLGIDLRREVVRELSNAGMSTRAPARVVGASHMTVSNDLAGVKPFTPAPLSDAPGTVTKLTGSDSAAEVIANPLTGRRSARYAEVATNSQCVRSQIGVLARAKGYVSPSSPSRPKLSGQ